MANSIHKKIEGILDNSKKINYKGIELYLISKIELDKILDLELSIREENEANGIKRKNHFYDYAKIINPNAPAFKYSLSMKHKKKEIFDPVKVKNTLPKEFEIWKNTERVKLKKSIENPDSAITDKQAILLKEELETRISIDEEQIQKVLANFNNYDVVISTFEEYTYYPSLYYSMEGTDSKKGSSSDTHLRQDVPNLLWYEDNRPYTELRSSDRMSRIIQTFERFCGTIYIKEKS